MSSTKEICVFVTNRRRGTEKNGTPVKRVFREKVSCRSTPLIGGRIEGGVRRSRRHLICPRLLIRSRRSCRRSCCRSCLGSCRRSCRRSRRRSVVNHNSSARWRCRTVNHNSSARRRCVMHMVYFRVKDEIYNFLNRTSRQTEQQTYIQKQQQQFHFNIFPDYSAAPYLFSSASPSGMQRISTISPPITGIRARS